MRREELIKYIEQTYLASPEYLWANDPSAVFRHADNRKWFALIMRIPKSKLVPNAEGVADVINLKCDVLYAEGFGKGIYPAYHMSKTKWISVDILSAEEEVIKMLLSVSFLATGQRKKTK